MDFNLFELDEDEDIFGSIQLEPSQKNVQPSPENVEEFPEFQCSGDDKNNAQFSDAGFIKNSFISSLGKSQSRTTSYIQLAPYGFTFKEIAGRGVAQYLFGEAFINVQNLVTNVQGGNLGNMGENTETTIYQRRQHVTKLLHLVLHCTQSEQWKFVRSNVCKLHDLINRICTKDLWKSIYFANSCKGNECNVPTYHLLHGILEWKLLDIYIFYKYGVLAKQSNSESDNRELDCSIFKVQLSKLLDDLLTCSLLLYAKKRSAELLFSTPFPCTCFKELWLILIVSIIEWTSIGTLEKQRFNFWILFTTAMMELKSKIQNYSISTLSFYEFATWIFCAVTRLHGFRSNGTYEGPKYANFNVETLEHYDFFEKCSQQFLTLNPSEEKLRTHLCLITPILLEWNRLDVLIAMVFWEHFHKRLNSSFYIPGAAPNNLAVACGSGRAYLERYRTMLEKSQTTTVPDANLSSYTLFTLLLGKCLQSLGSQICKAHLIAKRLLGRIYTKFSLQKFLALNETGIHHLIELFLILALSSEFNEMLPKFRDSLLSISLDKITTQRQIAVMKGHVAMLIICAEKRCDLSEYVTKILQQLKSIKNDGAVAKILADGLLDIFQQNDGNFQHGEHLLIDAWLPNLLQQCTPVEQERTFEALHLIFEKFTIRTKDDFVATDTQKAEVIKSLYTHILPFIKQQYITSFSEKLPPLAADFCLNIEAINFSKLFDFFVETPTSNRQALPQILLKILENERFSCTIDPAVLLHVWLRSLVLLTPQHTIVKKLTSHVIELRVLKKMTNLSTEELLQAKEPLCVFVAAVGKLYDATKDFKLRCEIADNFNSYVRNFEKWLSIGSDSKLDQQTEINFRFYSFLAIVIYNCPQIVYAKSKVSCFFHIAITRYILPTSIQMGKTPEPKLTQLVHKIWHVLVQGIGRLNFKTDSYIQKTLDDLILKWTPVFKAISTNTKAVARPFILCFEAENYNLSLYICERLTSIFIITQRRQADPNACLVISIFQEIICSIISNQANYQNSSNQIRRLESFMKGTCLLALEHIMMVDEIVPSRGMLLELLRRLISSAIFRSSITLQELFVEHLRIITKKHLAYYTYFYFDLLMKIAKISFESIEKIMVFLNDEIRIVEQKRGGGEDNRIRSCLQKLKQCIDAEKIRKTKMESPTTTVL